MFVYLSKRYEKNPQLTFYLNLWSDIDLNRILAGYGDAQ